MQHFSLMQSVLSVIFVLCHLDTFCICIVSLETNVVTVDLQ